MIEQSQKCLNFSSLCTIAFPFAVIAFYFVFIFTPPLHHHFLHRYHCNPSPPNYFHAFKPLLLCFSSLQVIFPIYFMTIQSLLPSFFHHLESFPLFVCDSLYNSNIHTYSTVHLGGSLFFPLLISFSQYVFSFLLLHLSLLQNFSMK